MGRSDKIVSLTILGFRNKTFYHPSVPPQPGLCQEGVYQRPGDPGRVALLLEEFTQDARNVKLRKKEHHLEDVTDTLKSFLSQAEDALLTKELYPYWVSALGMWGVGVMYRAKNMPMLKIQIDTCKTCRVWNYS